MKVIKQPKIFLVKGIIELDGGFAFLKERLLLLVVYAVTKAHG